MNSKSTPLLTLGIAFLFAILLAPETRGVGHPPPPPCDSGWAWAAINPPTGYTAGGPIADVGGTLYAVLNGGSQSAVMSYSNSAWTTVASGFVQSTNGNSPFIATIVSAGGRIYIGGDFWGFTDRAGVYVSATNVAEFTPGPRGTGTWSVFGTGAPTPVYALAIDTLGHVYAGLDRFAPPDPITSLPEMLVIWDTPSQTWLSVGGGLHLDAPYSNGCGGGSPAIALPWGITALTASGNDIYAAGYFDMCGTNVTTYHLAKWNYSSQSWSAIAPDRNWCFFDSQGAEPYISSLLVSNNLYVAGDFTPYCGGTSSTPVGLAEFSTNGTGIVSNTADNLWGAPFQYEGNTYYNTGIGYSLCLRGCGIYLAGNFQGIGSASGPGLAAYGVAKKINGAWAPINSGLTQAGAPGIGSYVASDPNADQYHVFVSGVFDTAGDIPTGPNITAWQGVPGFGGGGGASTADTRNTQETQQKIGGTNY